MSAPDASETPDQTRPVTAPKPGHGKPVQPPTAANDPQPSAPVLTVPFVSKPLRLGALVGPGSTNGAPDLRLYGTDLGVPFEHKGKLYLLFGDTWPLANSICESGRPQQDDTLATLPLEYNGGVPDIRFTTRADSPRDVSYIHVYRGSESLALGYGQAPMAGWSDGDNSYAVFERLEPAHCDAGQAPGSSCLDGNDQSFCSGDLGICTPAAISFPVVCDAARQDGCLPDQKCEATSLCIDRTSSQYDDGHLSAEAASVAFMTEIGVARGDDPTSYDSVRAWRTNKFSHPAVRTVSKWSGGLEGNDYRPGQDRLLFWGRPGFIAENGRQAQMYLMTHALPMKRDDKGQLVFTPQYFSGVDAHSGAPSWSTHESEAKAIALDGVVDGDPHEEVPIVGPFGVSWLPEPVNKWVMLYGGDLADFLIQDIVHTRVSRSPGAIMLRFADHPWGPWSPPVSHLAPGSPDRIGDPYGPGGFMYHPDCVSSTEARCTQSDPRRPLDTALDGCPFAFPDPGRLYAPNIIDNYTKRNADGGLDVIWDVSTWNPYSVQLFKTTITPSSAAESGSTKYPELADERGLERLSNWRALPELAEHPSRYEQQTSRDRGTSDSTFPLTDHGNRDFNNFVCASQDAQFAARQFATPKYDLATCPESYVKGVVLSRFEGPGRMVRNWIGMQSLVFAPADSEVLRIYVDDEPTPRVEVPLAAALDGSAGEMFAPPFGAASPHRLAWYYPVAFQHKLIVALDSLGEYDNYFYHCDVVRDAQPQAGALPTERLAQRDVAQRQLGALYHPAGSMGLLRDPDTLSLNAGASKSIELDGPLTLHELRVRFADSDYAKLATTRITVRWDGDKDAAIDLPLSDLLGGGKVPPELTSAALSSFLDGLDRVLSLKLPMPFERSAKLTFVNQGTSAIALELRLLGDKSLPTAPFGHLHARRNATLGPTTAAEHVAVDESGRGRLVGLCAYVQGHADPRGGIQTDPLNLLEADVRARVDGALALDGTGSEEYADDVFYFTDAPHSNAFVQAWGVVDDPQNTPTGQASFCRWHVLGTELDFTKTMKLSFELGGAENPVVVEQVKTIAFLYLP